LPGSIQEIDQWKIRDVLGIGVSVPLQPLDFIEIQSGSELLKKSGFSGARIATNREDPSFALT
jgi:hypothetical protein